MVIDPWPSVVGVVEFPNGVRVRGRALSEPLPSGAEPTAGLYLLGRTPPAVGWPSERIPWPDFALPTRPEAAVTRLREVFADAVTERLELACDGGRGRTGTAMAVLAIACGIEPSDAVGWVRRNYRPEAIETPEQEIWIETLTR